MALNQVTDAVWLIFIVSIAALLILDLGVFNRKAHVIRTREALLQMAFFISAAIVFNAGVYLYLGSTAGLEFTTGYLMELMLSVDNLFVIILIFTSFGIPRKYQHKVLFYGILGALVFRLTFILVGVTLVESFEWVLYIFGAFLIYTAIKMVVGKEKGAVEPERNLMVRFFRRFMRVTKDYHGDKFFVRMADDNGKHLLWATPMFIALLVIESTDIVFAVDSIPAILGITTSTFIVFSSNAFAVLGLRSMYFALSHIMTLFCYLKYGLAGILGFVGAKMLAGIFDVHVPVLTSLLVIVVILGVAMGASVIKTRRTNACALPAKKPGEGSVKEDDGEEQR